VPELKNLLETSDDDGIRRQARGTLEALGVVVETMSRTAPMWKRLSHSAMRSTWHGATSAAAGW